MARRSRSRRGRLWAGVYVGLFGMPDGADTETETETDGLPADDSDDTPSSED